MSLSPGEFARAFDVACDALRADVSRTRAALVALAIAMSIVVCLTTLVERGRAATIRSLERAGLSNLYLVHRASRTAGEVPPSRLTSADAERLSRLAGARSAVVIRTARETATLSGAPFPARIYAVSGPLARLFGMRARSGRLLGDLDGERKLPRAVLGADLARRNPNAPPGSIVTVGGRGYEIVGHLEESASESAAAGEIPSLDWDGAILVPLGTEPGSREESDARYPIDVAVLSFASPSDAAAAAQMARSLDPARYLEGPVLLASPFQTLRQYKQTRRTFDRLLWLIALLTGASAVIGISNLLSASVIARTREIGVRRAVGATQRDVLFQFLAEAVLISVAGGVAGILLGTGLSFGIERLAGIKTLVSFLSVVVAFGVSFSVGLGFGIVPAYRAAKQDPVECLRYE